MIGGRLFDAQTMVELADDGQPRAPVTFFFTQGQQAAVATPAHAECGGHG
jgi:hypothetical protein